EEVPEHPGRVERGDPLRRAGETELIIGGVELGEGELLQLRPGEAEGEAADVPLHPEVGGVQRVPDREVIARRRVVRDIERELLEEVDEALTRTRLAAPADEITELVPGGQV